MTVEEGGGRNEMTTITHFPSKSIVIAYKSEPRDKNTNSHSF